MVCCRELQTFIIAVYELSDCVSNWYSVCHADVDWYLVMFIDIAPFSSRFLYIHTFLTYNESKFDSNVIKKYSEIFRPAGDISHFLQRIFCQEFIFISWANVFPLFIASNILRNIFSSWRFSSQLVSQGILAHSVSILFFVHRSDF